MFRHMNRRFVKMFLIILSEFVAMVATHLFSKYIFLIHHSFLSYLICGALLAVVVITLYDKAVAKRRIKAEEELKELTNVALRIYHTHNK